MSLKYDNNSELLPTEQRRSFLKEDTAGEHLGDEDLKSTARLQSHHGCPLLGSGFLKIAVRVQIPFTLCPKKAKELSRGSGHFPVKPDAHSEVTACPEIKESLRDRGLTQGPSSPQALSFASVLPSSDSIMVGPATERSTCRGHG